MSRRGPESPPFHSGPPPTTFGDPAACYAKALDALARRSRSAKGLERWLARRQFTPDAIASAIERLQGLGLLDDLVFARGFAHARIVGRSFGARRVASELAREGVARTTIDLVLSELAGDAEGAADAVGDAARRRARSLSGLDPAVAVRRLTGWLIRRGFGGGESARAAREALAARVNA